MSRFALFSCSLAIVACGADGSAKKPTTTVAATAVSSSASASNGFEIEGGAADITLFREAEGVAPTLLTAGKGLKIWSASGEALAATAKTGVDLPRFVDVQGQQIWISSNRLVQEMNANDHSHGVTIELPEGTEVSALEVAFGGTVFVADARAMRVMALAKDKTQTVLEGETVGAARALLLNGGSLIIGTDTKLLSFNIKAGETKVLSEDLGSIVALAHDHLGYFIAATSAGEIRQVQGDGTSRLLHTLERPASGIVFDAIDRKLYLADSRGVAVHDYLKLTGEDKAVWASRDERLMRIYQKNGMTVAGGEYWPSHGTTNVSYPDDILWGFYPSPDQVNEGSAAKVAPPAAAIACAESSYRALQAFVDSNPSQFHLAAETRKFSKQFYLWVNDYTDAAADFPHEQRPAKFWYWERKPAVTGRVPGFWKWETTIMQDGSCHWPKPEQIKAFLAATLEGKE